MIVADGIKNLDEEVIENNYAWLPYCFGSLIIKFSYHIYKDSHNTIMAGINSSIMANIRNLVMLYR